jgi:threonine/homoserine/homoserine lactone efflux protein
MQLVHAHVVVETIGAAIVFGLTAGLSPGPLLALTISQSLGHGTSAGIKVAFAPFFTDMPIFAASLFALSRFARFGPFLGIVTVAGALFVFWLGVRSMGTSTLRRDGPYEAAGSLREGIVLNFLSPHPYIFWISVGMPLVLRTWPVSHAAGALFPVCFLSSLAAAKVAVAIMVGRSRKLLNDRAYALIMQVLGAILFVFALLLLWNGVKLLSKC